MTYSVTVHGATTEEVSAKLAALIVQFGNTSTTNKAPAVATAPAAPVATTQGTTAPAAAAPAAPKPRGRPPAAAAPAATAPAAAAAAPAFTRDQVRGELAGLMEAGMSQDDVVALMKGATGKGTMKELTDAEFPALMDAVARARSQEGEEDTTGEGATEASPFA